MMSRAPSNQESGAGGARLRLDSWKEIAVYLRRGTRTVRRWERQEGLPVHRHRHGRQATVYAFPHEIDAWLKSRSLKEDAHQTAPGHALQQTSAPILGALPKKNTSRPYVLAVLPLRNLDGGADEARFADGLTEELIMEIGQCCANRLRVIALNSVMPYKQSPKNIAQIGQELGADYILEGGIRRHGERVRLTARLIATKDQAHVWSESYEIRLPPIFSLQQALARQVADALFTELHITTMKRPRRTNMPSVAGHNAYIEGRSHFMLSEGESKKRIENLNLAIQRDPNFASSYAELALIYFRRLFLDFPPIVSLKRIEEYALKALKLDSKLALAHSMLAAYQLFGAWNWPKAQATTRQAIKLNPSDVWARIIRAAYHLVVEEVPEAIEELTRAQQLAPNGLEHYMWFALLAYFARQYDFAVKVFEGILRQDPSLAIAHSCLGLTYARMGNYAVAISHCEKARQLGGLTTADIAAACSVYALAGQRESAERLLQELLAAKEQEYVRYGFLAQAAASMDKEDLALDWLEKAYEQREPFLVFLHIDPDFETLSAHARFRTLLRRIGLPAHTKRLAAAQAG